MKTKYTKQKYSKYQFKLTVINRRIQFMEKHLKYQEEFEDAYWELNSFKEVMDDFGTTPSFLKDENIALFQTEIELAVSDFIRSFQNYSKSCNEVLEKYKLWSKRPR